MNIGNFVASRNNLETVHIQGSSESTIITLQELVLDLDLNHDEYIVQLNYAYNHDMIVNDPDAIAELYFLELTNYYNFNYIRIYEYEKLRNKLLSLNDIELASFQIRNCREDSHIWFDHNVFDHYSTLFLYKNAIKRLCRNYVSSNLITSKLQSITNKTLKNYIISQIHSFNSDFK